MYYVDKKYEMYRNWEAAFKNGGTMKDTGIVNQVTYGQSYGEEEAYRVEARP